MYELNEGDIVGRKSYNSDIVFEIKKIFLKDNERIAILQGVRIRIEADSPITDLELICKECEKKSINESRKNLKVEYRGRALIYTGRILHLDGELLYENVP